MDAVSPHDLNQGHLGNCWFIAACTSLALDQKVWHKVVPDVDEQVGVQYIEYSQLFNIYDVKFL